MADKNRRLYTNGLLDELGAVMPPAPSKNADFRQVHDEIPMLQNVAGVFLAVAASALDSRPLSRAKFLTKFTPHRNISTYEEIEAFIREKLVAPKRAVRRPPPKRAPHTKEPDIATHEVDVTSLNDGQPSQEVAHGTAPHVADPVGAVVVAKSLAEVENIAAKTESATQASESK